MVEHSLRTREVRGSNPDRVIPKTLKMVLTADVCVMLRTSIGVRNAKSPKTRTPIFLHSKSLRQTYNPESVGLALGGATTIQSESLAAADQVRPSGAFH